MMTNWSAGMHRSWGSVVGLVVAMIASVSAAAEKPNIIFVMADDLGYGDLGCFGQEVIQTPRIDEMAQEGMRLTDYYAGSTVCAPSRCVLMTGLHLGHCFIRGNGKDNLRPTDITVADVLSDAGYTCGLYGKWGLGHEGSEGVPTRQGFAEFFGYLDQHHAHNYYPTFLMKGEARFPLRNVVPGEGTWGQGVATKKVDYSHDLIMDAALEFVDASAKEPFFLYLSVTIPHANNEARDKGMEVPELGQYADKDWPEPQKGTAAMITRLDRDMGRLFERLKKHGIDERTLVIFTSDNGPHREGGNDPDFFDSNGPLRGIKRDLYEGGIRVPFIARWPGKIEPGSESEHISYHGDLMATCCDLAGVEAPKGLDSVSYLPTLLGNDAKQLEHEALYWEFYERGFVQAVRKDDWKLVRFDRADVALFDLSEDLGEENDIAAQHPDVVAKLTTIMEEAHVPNPRWKPRGKSRR